MSEQSRHEERSEGAESRELLSSRAPNASLSTTVNDFLQAFEAAEKVSWGTGGGGNANAQFLVDPFFTILGEERRDGSKMQQVHLSLLAVIREGRPSIVGRIFEGKEAEIQAAQRAWIEQEQSIRT